MVSGGNYVTKIEINLLPKKTSISLLPIGFWTFFLSALGYFVYGGLGGFLATFLYVILMGLTIILGLIPLLGIPLQVAAAIWLVEPFVFNLAGIHGTLLTAFIFCYHLVIGIIINISITLAVMFGGSD